MKVVVAVKKVISELMPSKIGLLERAEPGKFCANVLVRVPKKK